MYTVNVWIEHPVRSIDKTFSYVSDVDVQQCARVIVPFGKSKVTGFVESCEYSDKNKEDLEREYGFKLQNISEVIDEEALLGDELHDLAMQMHHDTLSPTIACFNVMLPSKIKPQGKIKSVVKEKWVIVSDNTVSLTPKQLQAYQEVLQNGEMLYRELRRKYPSIAPLLIKKQALLTYEKDRKATSNAQAAILSDITLTKSQNRVIQEIQESDDSVYVLRGVTGAGKTEIYLQLAAEALSNNKQVLFLVPEIGLTPQMIQRVKERFGSELAIYHSDLNAQEKYEQYQKVKENTAKIVVGTRSAVFLPFQSLGLIVMDEEHDPSYKQETGVAYHCRDIAVYRGNYHHCKVILGSATPSLETYARGVKGVYHLVEMEERINQSLPQVTLVDMKEMMGTRDTIVSTPLKQKIEDRLAKKEKIILLLNRRGYHSQLRCKHCGEVLMCPHCDIAMSYHKNENILKCHSCGTYFPTNIACPTCHSKEGFTNYGCGTERLEQELHTIFPQATTLRMDADTTARKNAHQTILEKFAEGKADILLGTQMIAKGLDFPDVTLVGILQGDNGLARMDYRSCEMTFDLLMQAAGRSGRANKQGEVIIQVFMTEHYAIEYAAKQDYLSFYKKEMQYRHAANYPPFTYLISLLIRHRTKEKVDVIARWVMQNMQADFTIIPPVNLNKIADYYRTRIILKGRDLEKMKKAVETLFAADKNNYANEIYVDVNPLTLD